MFELGDAKPGIGAPPGFRYQAEFISEAEERYLAQALAKLPLKPFEFHGHLGNRRVVSFGLRYDYSRREVQPASEPPQWVEAVQRKVAKFARIAADDIKQIGINEYRAGAGIGWHRDKAEFGEICGVSLLSTVKMRFRRKTEDGWIRWWHVLEPRSVYVLSGEAREVWEHSIAPVTSLRYSLTFRTLAAIENGHRSKN